MHICQQIINCLQKASAIHVNIMYDPLRKVSLSRAIHNVSDFKGFSIESAQLAFLHF